MATPDDVLGVFLDLGLGETLLRMSRGVLVDSDAEDRAQQGEQDEKLHLGGVGKFRWLQLVGGDDGGRRSSETHFSQGWWATHSAERQW
jgi:hypothetical protein